MEDPRALRSADDGVLAAGLGVGDEARGHVAAHDVERDRIPVLCENVEDDVEQQRVLEGAVVGADGGDADEACGGGAACVRGRRNEARERGSML